jgi:hypothetical protein
MTVEVKEVPNEPIILFSVVLPHTPEDDVRAATQGTTEFKKKWGGHVYRVVDLSHFELNFSQAMMGMAAERGLEGGVNDLEISTIYIGSGEWVTFGVKAFQEQAQYGQTNVIHICSTVDEGLAFARAHIEQNKK